MLNKKFLISVAAAAVLFTGCGDDKSSAQSTVAPVAQEEVKTEVAAPEVAQEAQIAQEEQVANETEQTVQDTQEAVEEVVEEGTQAAQEIVEEATQAVETAVQDAQEAVEEVAAAAEETVAQVQEEVAQQVESAVQAVAVEETPAVQDSAPAVDAAPLYVKCVACHGANAEKVALGKSAIIKDWDATQIAEALKGYKAGTYGGAMKGVMVGQVANLSDEQIDALAEHIAAF